MSKLNFNIGLFGKIFLYTLLFLIIVIVAFTVFYAEQLQIAFNLYNRQQHIQNFRPLLQQLELAEGNIEEIARDFRTRNESFEFSIRSEDGTVMFETPVFTLSMEQQRHMRGQISTERRNAIERGEARFAVPIMPDLHLYVANMNMMEETTNSMIVQILPFSLTLLAVSAIGALLLARLIAKPIKKLAVITTDMANLEEVPLPPARGDEIGNLSRDVHSMYQRLKHTIGELEREIKHKEEIEENQRAFFSAASHELKTPIAGTTAIIEAMMEDIIEQEEYPSYLNQCLDMMNAQSRLISEILEIVRYNEGKMKLKPESFPLASFIESILPTYKMLTNRKQQELKTHIPTGITIHADRAMLSKVVSNILMNAITNAPEQSEIRIWYEASRLCILNTKTQIPDAELPKLFEPFYRADKSRTRSQGRSGLGLAIVKRILDTMKIPFALENNQEGVLFWMEVR